MNQPDDLLLVGLSHHTAPIAVREKVAITESHLEEALHSLRALPEVREAMVLSTCNRLEVYAATPAQAQRAGEAIRAFLSSPDPAIDAHLYERRGLPAIRHLFRVCSSLDSMVVGEPQILGQVKAAYQRAEEARSLGGLLSRSTRKAFSVAKRVRTETEVGRSAVSMSFAAVELAKKILGTLEGRRVLLVGAGKMSALAARHLVAAGCKEVHVTNRSPARAEELASEVGGVAHPWEKLPSLLVEADVLVCSTAAPQPIITKEMILLARKSRKHRPLFLIDLAVPRDVDPKVNDLEDIYLFDVDDLDRVTDENREARRSEASRAEGIVEREAEAFFAAIWSEAEPILRRLRVRAEEIAQSEVARTLGRHGDSLTAAQRESVEALARAIVNKLLHQPTIQIREAGLRDDGALLGAAATLFDIEMAQRERAAILQGAGPEAPLPLVRPLPLEAEDDPKRDAPALRRKLAIFGSGSS